MMKERTSGKIFTLTLIVAIFAVLLAGCGEKEPKFGERVKDYKGFKTLKEEKIIVKSYKESCSYLEWYNIFNIRYTKSIWYILENKELAFLSRELATIKTDMDLSR